MGYNYAAHIDYMDLDVRCYKKAVKLNHSLTHQWLQRRARIHMFPNVYGVIDQTRLDTHAMRKRRPYFFIDI